MLVLSRKTEETILVNGPCVVKVLDIRGGTVRLGIEADKEVKILRGELEKRHEPTQDEQNDQTD